MSVQELSADKLRFICSEENLNFETTASLQPLEDMIGQERAVKAVNFGLATKSLGYNIFISGSVGTGKITYAKAAVKKVAQDEDVPNDWCYVNNFENQSQPIALSLPAGYGSLLKKDMEDFVDNLKSNVPKAFNSEDYEEAKNVIVKELQLRRAGILDKFNVYAEGQGILPQWSTTGFVGLPIKDGKQITPEDFQKLDKAEREVYEKKLIDVHEKAMEAIRQAQQLEKQAKEELKKLDEKIGLYAVGYFIEELKTKYKDFEKVLKYFDEVKEDVVKNIGDFKSAGGEEETNPLLFFNRSAQGAAKDKYKVNVLVENRDIDGAPVVVETNPTYYNLIGRVEYENRMGVVTTGYIMIKSGAIHRANGGYLILNARDILTNIGAWEGLKRVLKTKKIFIENLGEQYGMLALASLKPQAIAVDIKVILVGSPYIYYLLYNHDEDFRKLFKIYADFDVVMDNNDTNIKKLIGFITGVIKRENLKAFNRQAVARVIEYATRVASTQKKLTTKFSDIVEILCEADTWATIEQSSIVAEKHINKAICEKRNRSNKYEEKLLEMFKENKYLIDTDEEKIGQVNGLAVLCVGDYAFGKPSRITANTFIGKHGVINIERETKMSGTSHSKGVMILSGYLGQKYAQKQPLTLTASLTFEQMYEGVDGDSASSTELYAILSSLAEVPIKQYIAVTGSVNQKGEIQPIGGATQKIEGFFEVCKLKGLTGKQGVMLPYQNVDELTLNDEVVEAVKQGKFHIYPVKTIDEGIEVLTGTPAGSQKPDDTYAEGTIHYLVNKKMQEFTHTLLKLAKQAEEK